MGGTQTVAVIGLGYIGLPTAAILATNGVLGHRRRRRPSDRHVDAVNRRGPLRRARPRHPHGRRHESGHVVGPEGDPKASTYIVAVPTPFKDGYEADLNYIEAATDAIIPQLEGGGCLILESTSPPGATEHMARRVFEARPRPLSRRLGSRPSCAVRHAAPSGCSPVAS